MAPNQRIILGIDFGTTYSGVAWANSSRPDEILPIRQWPAVVGREDRDKVPSEMAYSSDGKFKWGYELATVSARRDYKILQYMKLLLDPTQERNDNIADRFGLIKILADLPDDKDPVDVIADYLREIKNHALNQLQNQFGTEFWKVIPVEYHLTIPAVWSDFAKAMTLKAANQADIGTSQDLVLIAEPEAAALYCLTDISPAVLKEGDTFVVADCGGGTVDLVSYEIIKREPKLEVKEVAVGGGLCGSVFLNRRFERFMRNRLGEETVDAMLRKGRPYWTMMTEFDEKLKRTFGTSDDQGNRMDCPVPGLPDDRRRRVESGFMEIDRNEIQEVFDPVIDEILRLIQEQIDHVADRGHKGVSHIVLVGGFGSSKYLFNRLKNHVPEEIAVIQPPNAWSAVARGAVICGLQTVSIQSRKARRNYGVSYSEPFQSFNPKHKESHKLWCHVQEMNFCIGLMKWYVRKGDEIPATKKISFEFCKTYESKQEDLKAHIMLLASNSAGREAEDYLTHPNVYKVCAVECDLSGLRSKLIERRNERGKVFYTLPVSIVMNIHSAQLTFGLEHDGVAYAGANFTVTFI